jgi:hypothetical protein
MEREYGHFVVRCLAALLMLAVLCCDLAGVTDEHPQD